MNQVSSFYDDVYFSVKNRVLTSKIKKMGLQNYTSQHIMIVVSILAYNLCEEFLHSPQIKTYINKQFFTTTYKSCISYNKQDQFFKWPYLLPLLAPTKSWLIRASTSSTLNLVCLSAFLPLISATPCSLAMKPRYAGHNVPMIEPLTSSLN